jgi:sporulation protein YlmC with PRC-barrel domain
VDNLIGKQVVVETEETTYTGKLVEMGEEEVHLESESGWIVIPVDRVASIREKD